MIAVNEGLSAEEAHMSQATINGYDPNRGSSSQLELEKTQGILRLIT